MSDVVLTEVNDGVMTVTLNRPEAKNAVNLAMAEGIAAAMDELDSNDAIRVAILTGSNNTFCSGMDLKAFVSGEVPFIAGRGFGGLTEAPPAKPLIAAIEGYALAGGCELAMVCDLVVAAETARFGIPEVKRGLAAAAGGLMRFPRQLPYRVAMELALTGDFMDASRARDLGFINQTVAEGQAVAAAHALAAKIAGNGPLAVKLSKQVVRDSQDWATGEMFAKQQEILQPVFTSEDAIEGATAFAEKRAPNWKGR
ncbi:MAG: crotonase/enoyl-CoA hydratase family protein [Cellvibrionales bacterium]|jgi:enoyl-CoA hydratase